MNHRTPLLDRVNLPADLRALPESDLRQVADELRAETVSAVSVTGGHLGAGLGVVELDREVDIAAATRSAVECGVWLRPFRDLIYTMPPFVTGPDDVARIAGAVVAAATAG